MRRKKWWLLALILYVLYIFGNSMQTSDVSSGQSMAVLEIVIESMAAVGVDKIGITEHIIRKMAHFAEYTLLGILICQNVRLRWSTRHEMVLYACLSGFAVPFTDETIQLFVDGRSGQISDVWLDMSGVTFGVCIMLAAAEFIIRKRGKLQIGKEY